MGLFWFCLVFIFSLVFSSQIDLFVSFFKEWGKIGVDGRDELSSFYSSSDFNNSGDAVKKQGELVGEQISLNQNISDDKQNEVKPVTDLEDQTAKGSPQNAIVDGHSADVLADAIRAIMDDKDS